MAVLNFEGFDHQAVSPITYWLTSGTGWTLSSTGSNRGTGLLGQTAWGIPFNSTATYDTQSNYGTLIVGFRLFNTNGTSGDFFRFTDSGTVRCGLFFNGATGLVSFWRGTNSTILATGVTSLLLNAWYFIELKVTFSPTVGTYELRIGNNVEFAVTGANTSSSSTCSRVDLRASATLGSFTYFDDFYLCDTSGAVANDFLGNIRVETSFPSSDQSIQFTPLSSTNASNLDEAPHDGDTTYNSSTSVGSIDLLGHGGLVQSPTTIYGVAVVSAIRKVDTPTATVRNKMVSGATTSNGASHTTDLSTVYAHYRDQWLVDPNTGVAWTPSAVNATKIGYEYVA